MKNTQYKAHRTILMIGVVCMILFYSAIPRRDNEQQINYQQGQY